MTRSRPHSVSRNPRSGGPLAVATLSLFLLTTLAPTPAPAAQESVAYTGVIGVGSALCTLVYGPLKLAHAAGGLVLTGLTWLWTGGDIEPARHVFRSAVGGDYVVTPAHLTGERDLRFRGDS